MCLSMPTEQSSASSNKRRDDVHKSQNSEHTIGHTMVFVTDQGIPTNIIHTVIPMTKIMTNHKGDIIAHMRDPGGRPDTRCAGVHIKILLLIALMTDPRGKPDTPHKGVQIKILLQRANSTGIPSFTLGTLPNNLAV